MHVCIVLMCLLINPHCFSPQLVPELREEAKKLEEKVQAFEKLKDMEQRVGKLEMELHWAIVYEIESVSSHVLSVRFCVTFDLHINCNTSNRN